MTGRKCVLMELDGATLTRDGAVPPALANLILRTPAVHWVMVTGRSYASAVTTEFGSLLRKDSLHIFDSGTLIATLAGKILHRRVMSTTDAIKLCTTLYMNPWESAFGSSGVTSGLKCSREPLASFPQAARHTEHLSTFLYWVFAERVQKLSVTGMDIACIPGQINHYTCGNTIHFLPPGVSKVSGIQNILHLLSVRPEDTAFVFNDINDLSVAFALPGIHLIKVGANLPHVPAHTVVREATDVATALSNWLPFGRRDNLRGATSRIA
jgi:hydroxymethylpyrimidine pyrophosphatase-like HAD family hydrolase